MEIQTDLRTHAQTNPRTDLQANCQTESKISSKTSSQRAGRRIDIVGKKVNQLHRRGSAQQTHDQLYRGYAQTTAYNNSPDSQIYECKRDWQCAQSSSVRCGALEAPVVENDPRFLTHFQALGHVRFNVKNTYFPPGHIIPGLYHHRQRCTRGWWIPEALADTLWDCMNANLRTQSCLHFVRYIVECQILPSED